jgi:hypothetical protein
VVNGSGRFLAPITNNSGGVVRVGATDSLQITGASANSGQLQMVGGGSMNLLSGLTNSAAMQISGGGDANVFGTLTNNSGGKVTVSGNSVATFWNNVTNNLGSQIQVSAGSTAVFFGNVTGIGNITGSGTTDFEGGTTAAAAGLQATGTAIVGSPFNAVFVRDNTLMVNSAATITAKSTPNSSGGTTVVNSLSFSNGGKLDLTNNSLIVDYTGSPGTLVNDTRAELQAGSLTSSSADTRHRLGYADNQVLGKSSFAGQTVDATSLLVKYTFNGDANLDGTVNALDFNALANGYGKTPGSEVWSQGDFNYDGAVNSSDFAALAANYGQVMPSNGDVADALPLAAFVPEPGSAILFAVGGMLLARRRTQRRIR